jgi:hypothetical protein
MVHVHGHMDKHLRRDQLTPLQRVNIRADEFALSALMAALATQTFTKDLFPSKGVIVSICTKRITGSPKAAITHLWGEQVAQELFHQQGIVHMNDFPLVYWEGMDKVMRWFPETFWVWVTKHVSNFNGTNRMLSRFPATETRAKVANKCPHCGCADEFTAHIPVVARQGPNTDFLRVHYFTDAVAREPTDRSGGGAPLPEIPVRSWHTYYGLLGGSAISILPGRGISRSAWVGQLPQGPN